MTVMQEKKEAGSLLFIKKENFVFTVLVNEGEVKRFDAFENNASCLGGIYVGKVKNVIKGMKAAFVEYASGKVCFLPLERIEPSALLSHGIEKPVVQGDEILIQIVSEAIKTKDPTASTQIAVTGKYLVVTLGKTGVAFSKKIEREQVQRLAEGLEDEQVKRVASKYGVIIRTNAQSSDIFHIRDEIISLEKILDEIIQNAPHRTCFSCLLDSNDGFLSVLRDYPSNLYNCILTDSEEIHQKLLNELKSRMPEDMEKLSLYQDSLVSLDKLYSFTKHLDRLTSKKVYLSSGAYLVIEPTEALVSVDVNSGKANMGKDREEAYFHINLEAAKEIVNQMILRNLSGVILIDFINMKNKEYERLLLDALNGAMKNDPLKSYVVDMTALGLVEITRKKKRKALHEILF